MEGQKGRELGDRWVGKGARVRWTTSRTLWLVANNNYTQRPDKVFHLLLIMFSDTRMKKPRMRMKTKAAGARARAVQQPI